VVPIAKAAGIITITEELARLSSPDAEDVARNDMINGIVAFVDGQFLDPAVAAVTGVNPASVTNGVTPIASVGPLNDVVAIAAAFAAANLPLTGLTYIMSPTNALVLSMLRDSMGALAFPGMSPSGGNMNGLQVVVSGAAGTNIIGLIPSQVLYADDGGVTIDTSREASLQMSDAPDDPVAATTVMVSLWQANLVGIRAEWFVSWLKANASAVKYVSGASFTIPTPSAMSAQAPEAKGNHKRGE
jgi:HK97 family phage major capsid protein